MRFRALTSWTMVSILLGSIGYSAAFTTASYLETTHLVDRIASEAAAKGKAAVDAQAQAPRQQFASAVRSGLLAASGRPGTVLTRDGVAVAETSEGVRVTVHWNYPLLSYGGRAVLSVPLSVDRSISMRP